MYGKQKIRNQGLLTFPLNVLNKLGLLVPNSLKTKIFVTFLQLQLFFGVVAASWQFLYIEWDIFAIIDNLQSVLAFTQILIFNKNKMLNLIQLTQSFWSSKDCSKYAKEGVNGVFVKVEFLQKLFLYSVYCLIPIMMITSYIMDNSLPFGTWAMVEYTKLYQVAFILNSTCAIFGGTVCCGFDGLFLGFCYEVILQFKIFCDCLEKMNVEKIKTQKDLNNHHQQLKTYIERHKFLLSFIKEMQDCYSIAYTVQYLTTAPLICTAFYATFESKQYLVTLQFGILCVLEIIQIAFYCIASECVAQEVLTVSNAIYNSNWYGKHFKILQKSTLLMIQQSQRGVRFTACGLIDMNIDTLIKIIKIAFSSCTFLRSLKK